MARVKKKQRTTNDQLAMQVRKNFNNLAVKEDEVITELLYKIKNKGMSAKIPQLLYTYVVNAMDVNMAQTKHFDKSSVLRSHPQDEYTVERRTRILRRNG